jgi:DNA invertase Pin-like site-specific DNA recombinase
MEHKVHFIVAAHGKDCDDFTLHIYASIAEQERKMISERIRSGTRSIEANSMASGEYVIWRTSQHRLSSHSREACHG